MTALRILTVLRTVTIHCAVLASLATGCKKSTPPPADPAAASPAAAPAPAAAPEPAAATPAEPPAAATEASADAPPADPAKNGWGLAPRGTAAKEGDRVYVLTQGKDRSYTNASAIYHLFAHEMGEVRGDDLTIRELGGGSFKTTGLFVIPGGVAKLDDLKAGDMVLAEWASSLKHATVVKVEAPDRVHVRYTDLPHTWGDDKLVAVKTLHEVTKQKEGLAPGNFAVAQDDGRPILVLLVAEAGDQWLALRFNWRASAFATKDLTPIPLAPKLKVGQAVQAPWVGMMYSGKVKAVAGTRVDTVLEGIATTEPVVTSLGQVLPVVAAKGK